MSREVKEIHSGVAATDGAGVKLKRLIGNRSLDMVDPFLMLDEFKNDDPNAYIAGFPPHPHRGFETITYMIEGKMRHRDSRGNEGLLGPGAVQWMTAGRGIIHSEMPEQENGMLWGYQLWLNLPARHKMVEPAYQDIPSTSIPEIQKGGCLIRLVAGSFEGVMGAAETFFPVTYMDLQFQAADSLLIPLPEGDNALVVGVTGGVRVGSRQTVVNAGQVAVTQPGSDLLVVGSAGDRALVVSAAPIREPIARYGPFVMNTQQEIYQAFADYEAGRLG